MCADGAVGTCVVPTAHPGVPAPLAAFLGGRCISLRGSCRRLGLLQVGKAQPCVKPKAGATVMKKTPSEIIKRKDTEKRNDVRPGYLARTHAVGTEYALPTRPNTGCP